MKKGSILMDELNSDMDHFRKIYIALFSLIIIIITFIISLEVMHHFDIEHLKNSTMPKERIIKTIDKRVKILEDKFLDIDELKQRFITRKEFENRG